MEKYQVVDYYENYGIIDCFDTAEEARKCAENWKEETDGECDVYILRLPDKK